MEYTKIIVDDPRPHVRRITLNRPEKRNPLSNELRSELFAALQASDTDPEVRVTVIRGAGSCFSAGYDLASNVSKGQPFYTAGGLGNWPRHVVEGFFHMWDMAKPIIAQVHGYCLAGGTELATACDLVYVAEDAKIGYPVVRSISPPDNQFYPWIVGLRRAMELMLTGDHMSGLEAVESGFANRAFPEADLEDNVLRIAERVAKVPSDLQQINKRAVHRQMDAMGIRAGIRAGTEMQQLATYTATTQAHLEELRKGLTAALSKRDSEFGDYRTGSKD
jgi:enoyl-CoA hydratase